MNYDFKKLENAGPFFLSSVLISSFFFIISLQRDILLYKKRPISILDFMVYLRKSLNKRVPLQQQQQQQQQQQRHHLVSRD